MRKVFEDYIQRRIDENANLKERMAIELEDFRYFAELLEAHKHHKKITRRIFKDWDRKTIIYFDKHPIRDVIKFFYRSSKGLETSFLYLDHTCDTPATLLPRILDAISTRETMLSKRDDSIEEEREFLEKLDVLIGDNKDFEYLVTSNRIRGY